jgi:putative SOS response-associated peptidase YedK
MCGRYTLYHTRAEIEDFFQVSLPPQFGPRYNIAPTQPVLIVRENPHVEDGGLEAEHVVWGLIPPWAEDPKIGSKMINARCETAAEKASYKHALRRRRCIVPVSGFYEWQTSAGGRKQPYLIKHTGSEPLALAGLWDTWHGPNGELIESCTILTTSAIPKLQGLHDRMPVIIPQENIPTWLDRRNEDVAALARYFVMSADCEVELRPVSVAVNSVRNDGPELVRELGMFDQ